jgi:UDPglucose 6-dehydrogenase
MVKYATNAFLATKVSFFNQLYDICSQNDTNYDKIKSLLLYDKRIGNSHMSVPGPDGMRGFGGACFPKDTTAFLKYVNTIGSDFSILKTAIEYNRTVRKTLDL